MDKKKKILEKMSEMSLTQLEEMINNYVEKIQRDGARRNRKIYDDRLFVMPESVRRSYESAQKSRDENLSRWAKRISSLPSTFMPPLYREHDLIVNAKRVWGENVCGLEEVYRKIILYAVAYAKTGKQKALLLAGMPGCGKTTVAKIYAEILGLPYFFINGPRAARGRGLSGDAAVYQFADAGELVSGICQTGCANPVFVIDEIDKVPSYAGTGGTFADEVLSLLDDSSKEFMDNYLTFSLNLSHSPVILTANDLKSVSEPLLDRCEVIEFPENSKEDIADIVKKITLPNALNAFDCKEQVIVEDKLVDTVVEKLYGRGIISIRTYQTVISNIVNQGYIRYLETDHVVNIEESEINNEISKISGSGKKVIGF